MMVVDQQADMIARAEIEVAMEDDDCLARGMHYCPWALFDKVQGGFPGN